MFLFLYLTLVAYSIYFIIKNIFTDMFDRLFDVNQDKEDDDIDNQSIL